MDASTQTEAPSGTTTSVGTPPALPINTNIFDTLTGNGLGALSGIVLLAVLAIFNWKMNSRKKSIQLQQNVDTNKQQVNHEISINNEKVASLMAVLHSNEKLSKDQQQKIADITTKASEEIKTALSSNDMAASVEHILKNWRS